MLVVGAETSTQKSKGDEIECPRLGMAYREYGTPRAKIKSQSHKHNRATTL